MMMGTFNWWPMVGMVGLCVVLGGILRLAALLEDELGVPGELTIVVCCLLGGGVVAGFTV